MMMLWMIMVIVVVVVVVVGVSSSSISDSIALYEILILCEQNRQIGDGFTVQPPNRK
jgi:hypothetical protein